MMPLDSNELLKARDRLLAGDVVAVPTETVYGLAASIDSPEGLRRVFALKERPFFDPLIVHVASFKQASSVVRDWPPLADFLTRTFWPGPLTVVLPKAEHVNPLITSGLDTVAVRFPAHPLVQDLIKLVGAPLAAPSANKFGRTSPSRAEHVRSEFPDSAFLILDGGECTVGLESTVVSFSIDEHGRDRVHILRPGGITEEMLRASLEKWSRPTEIVRESSDASPGHLKHHYMPKIPLVIVGEGESLRLMPATLEKLTSELKVDAINNATELALSSDAAVAARELYSEMRRLAESGADLLFVRRANDRTDGLWQAIWDRLERAASIDLS